MSLSKSVRLLDDRRCSVALAPLLPPSDGSLAFASGYEEARAAGRREALQEHSAAMEAERSALAMATEALQGAARSLAAVRREEVALGVSDAASVAFAVVQELVGPLQDRPALWLPERLAKALDMLPDDCEPTVRLNPDDLAVIEEGAAPSGARLLADASVARGGCLVQTGPTTIDAGIDSAVKRLRGLLEEADQ